MITDPPSAVTDSSRSQSGVINRTITAPPPPQGPPNHIKVREREGATYYSK